MAPKRGFAAVAQLRERAKTARGGKPAPEGWPVAMATPDGAALDALSGCALAWLDSLTVRGYAGHTLDNRRLDLGHFLRWAAERDVGRAGEVTRPILEAYQRGVSRHLRTNGKPLGWSSQRQRVATLKDWFRWLTRQNLILHNPASELELPRMGKRLPVEALTQSEVARLLAVPDVADPLGLRDRAMLELFYSTGLRRAELCRLERTDLNSERGTLTVRQGKGRKDRVVPVGARAAAWVARYEREARPRLCLDSRTQTLFLTAYGEAFNPDVVTRQVAAWIKAAGIEKKGSCHLLRHACATHMLEGGADIRFIQQQLGHEKLETTAIYTEVTIRQLLEVHARCHPSAQLPTDEKNAPSTP
jgi:integrase/recombinase XerD